MAEMNALRYKGYRYNGETGLYYLIARYYAPAEGVFLAVDPEGGDMDDPKTQNGYAYASSNPVMYTDPDGNYIWVAVKAAFAAYDGYKAYKAGRASGKKGWALAGSVAWAAGSSFVKVGHLKKAGKALSFSKKHKYKKKLKLNLQFFPKEVKVKKVRRKKKELLKIIKHRISKLEILSPVIN